MIVNGQLAYWILRSLWWERQWNTTVRPLTPYSISGNICGIIQHKCYAFIPDKSFSVTHLMNHMKNQISALSDPFSSLNNLLRTWLGVEGSWLKYLLIIPLMLLAILFVVYLFYKIIVSFITKCMTEPPMKTMITRLEAVDQMYSSIRDQWL